MYRPANGNSNCRWPGILIVADQRSLAEKLPAAQPALQELLTNMPLEICADPSPSDIGLWEKAVRVGDAPMAAASAAEVDALVSGDGHFLKAASAAKKNGLRVISPADFL